MAPYVESSPVLPGAPGTPGTRGTPGRPGRRRGKRRRSAGEKILLGLIVVVVVALVGSGALYGYVRYRFGQVQKVAVPSLAEPAPATGAPYNVLLVGSDSRQGVTSASQAQRFGSPSQVVGARSDVIKILHIDPAAGTATLLDIPRDTLVPMSGTPADEGTINRVNVPFGTSADALVQTIQNTFGIPISHYVEIDFFGFEGAVDSVGGVYLDFPYPAKDTYTGLDVTQAGCQHVNGGYSLAVARSRHFEYFKDGYWHYDPTSDFGRIQRQDAFLKALVNRAESQYDPLTLNAFLGSVVHDVTIDDTFTVSQLISLSQRYHAFSSGSLQSYTLPTYSDGSWGSYGDVLFVQEPEAQQVITQFLGQAPNTPTTPPIASDGRPVVVPQVTVPAPTAGSTTSGGSGGAPAAGATTTTAPPVPDFDPTPCSP